jgi:NMD protein affecting ribosome stability and mRNA decay
MDNREQITHHCPLCGHEADRAGFQYMRGLGAMCASCFLARVPYDSIEEYQRETWRRGSPRDG